MPKTSTSWKPGQTGNPNGRPKGSRDTINEAFLKDLATIWRETGLEALRRACEERPAEFCRMTASLQPKDQNLKVDDGRQSPFLDLLKQMNEEPGLEKEIARLKEENAALKGETSEDEPETTTDLPAVH
jgi:hypothetical protein